MLEIVFRYLHDEAKVKGVIVFRGITGFRSIWHNPLQNLICYTIL